MTVLLTGVNMGVAVLLGVKLAVVFRGVLVGVVNGVNESSL